MRVTRLPSFEDQFGRDGSTFAGVRQTRFGARATVPTDLGDLNWGGTDRGSIYLKNVGSVTHCYVNIDNDAPAELDIAIFDGAVRAGVYTAADFDFV